VPAGRWSLRAWLRWAQGPAEIQVAVPGAGAVELEVVESSPEPTHLDKRGRPYSSRSEAYQKQAEKK
jgi:hypothetical protein